MGTHRIVSTSDEPFEDRAHAGRALAAELAALRGKGAVVLGIPRGGVVVAAELADGLDADLDVVLARKLGAPGQPELAMGAVSEDGKLFLDRRIAGYAHAEEDYIEAEKRRQTARMRELAEEFRAVRPKVPLAGRTVVITDDGVATGATMRAAAWAAAHEKPARLILAVPVAPPDAAASLAADADEVIVLRAPAYFGAVGQFYRDFEQTSDAEVVALLRGAARREEKR